jgi:hypothetical protein
MADTILDTITSRRPKPLGPNIESIHYWFWKFVPVDPLVFWAPDHDGSTVQIAREVYHRLIGRLVADKVHGMQLGILAIAWVLTVYFKDHFGFRGADTLGWLLAIGSAVALLIVAAPALTRIACPSSTSAEALAIVKRTFLRAIPENTPLDLRDELQQGWLTADGRPLSSEISAEDGRTIEANRRSIWWIITALGVFFAVSSLFASGPSSSSIGSSMPPIPADASPLERAQIQQQYREMEKQQREAERQQRQMAREAGSGMGIPGLGLLDWIGSPIVLLLFAGKFFLDKRPVILRMTELTMAESAEGTGFVAAGGQSWGAIAEAARQRQMLEAASDTSPVLSVGETTGVFAGRGDFFGPRGGLPFHLSLRDLQMHMLVFGGTGSGKTSGLLRPLARQISGYDRVGLVVMDGKGSLPAELADLPGMKIIDPGREGTDVSLVSGVEPSVIVDTLRETLAPAGGGEDQFWINSASAVLRRGAVIAKAAGGPWWSLFHSAQIVSLKDDRDKVIDALEPLLAGDPLLREACGYFRGEWDTQMDERTRNNILAVIRSWLSTITATPELLRWARTPAGSDTVDLMSPLSGGRLGIVIPEHRYGVAGAVVTALLKARLYNGLKARADRDWTATKETPVVFVIDEAQEVATSQDAQMLPIGRSLGLAMVAATQGVEGVEAKLGEAMSAKWLTIFGTVAALSGRSPSTDAFVASRAGEVWQITPADVDGNTVRGRLSREAISGPIAAARTQPHLNVSEFGTRLRWFLMPMRMSTASNPETPSRMRKLKGEGATGPRLTLGPKPLFSAGEVGSLTAVPDTAIVLATRGRVPRRDVVRLVPEYPKRGAAPKVESKCPNCHSDVEPGGMFCGTCGTRLVH